MPDIDRIIKELLGNRRLSESATFSSRSYADQPLIEKGSDLKERMERRAQERAARHEREAQERRAKAREQGMREQDSARSQRWNVVSGGKSQQGEAGGRGSQVARSRAQEHLAGHSHTDAVPHQTQAQPEGSPTRMQQESSDRPERSNTWQEYLNSKAHAFVQERLQSIVEGASSERELSRRLQRFSFDLDDEQPHARRTHHPPLEPLPELIQQMRQMEGTGVPRTLAYGSKASAELFYRQAKLMEDYEDDAPYAGPFMEYYPTYAQMTDSQLRGYFTWRTRVRAGQMERASLSFAFVYVYELLMGIGTTPGRQGLADLRAFGQAYRQTDEALGIRLGYYLRDWLMDYAVYHDIPEAYQRGATVDQESAVLTLFKAEHAYLKQNKRSPHIPHPSVDGTMPPDEQIFQALGEAASYHITTSRLAKSEPELVRAVALDVFYALVMHCSRRRKTDYVEGEFGYASRYPVTMFAAAVFYESEPHPDCTVRVSEAELYECKDGRWWHVFASERRNRSSELGLAMHAVDYELRERLGYAYPLKRRGGPKYLWKIVQDTVSEHLERRAEAERRRITIDLSKLGDIRAAAAVTQEALLTDEERGEEPVAMTTAPNQVSSPEKAMVGELGKSGHGTQTRGESGYPPHHAAIDSSAGRHESSTAVSSTPVGEVGLTGLSRETSALITPDVQTQPEPDGPLSAEEAQFLTGLLEGVPATELLGARAQFVSVVVDSINEKLFDVVGDAVIEFDGDNPCIVEDYQEDVREVLHA